MTYVTRLKFDYVEKEHIQWVWDGLNHLRIGKARMKWVRWIF